MIIGIIYVSAVLKVSSAVAINKRPTRMIIVTVGVKYHVENETLLSMHCSQILLIVALAFQIRDRKDDYVEKARFKPY